ncbi:MAG TPA: ABC transporter permease [Bacillales bacterium]|nr:ABC transporter permease [Bacillales bacterium]
MSWMDSLKMAWSSIFAHKLRSILTMLGIVIGVGAVITVVAIGQGGQAALESQIAGGGNNTLTILYRVKDEKNSAVTVGGAPNRPERLFTQEDVYYLKKVPEIKQVITTNSSTSPVRFHEQTTSALVEGISNGYYQLNRLEMKNGRKITASDVQHGRKVALISQTVKKSLFTKDENPVGQVITLGRTPVKIVGVFTKSAGGLFNFQQEKVLVPLSLWPIMYGTDEIDSLTVQARSADVLQAAGERAVTLLNQKHANDDGEYYVFNIEQIKQAISRITGIMTMIVGGIASIALLVGGIGVMNIMLVSVTERTREIGIRKALGATRRKILLQFLIESVVLTTIGGIIGIGFGAGGAYLVSIFANWPPLVSLPVVIGGVIFSMIVGVIFGILPANKAAKLDPIDALRYE